MSHVTRSACGSQPAAVCRSRPEPLLDIPAMKRSTRIWAKMPQLSLNTCSASSYIVPLERRILYGEVNCINNLIGRMLARFYKSVPEWPHWTIGRSPKRCVDWVPFRALVHLSGISKHPTITHTQGMHMSKLHAGHPDTAFSGCPCCAVHC